MMATRIQPINRVVPTVEIGVLVEDSVAGDESTDLAVVITSSDMHQPSVAVVAVSACGREHVRVGAAACGVVGLPKRVIADGPADVLRAWIGDYPFAAD